MATCTFIPKSKKTGKASELFKNLLKLLNNARDDAKILWSTLTESSIIAKLVADHNIPLDLNGEPEIREVNKVFPLRNLSENYNFQYEKEELGVLDKDGKEQYYSTYDEALFKTEEFNDNNPDAIAYPEGQNGAYTAIVEKKTPANENKHNEEVFKDKLNQKLSSLMRRLGFTVIYDNSVSGIFDPINAEETADGLKTVIRIQRGQVGEDSMPEEWSHWFISGLESHPIVQRLKNIVDNDEILQAILGEEYNSYVSLYSDENGLDREKLILEALGQLLQNEIVNGSTFSDLTGSDAANTLASRLWENIKERLQGTSVEEVDKIIDEIRSQTLGLVKTIKDESFIASFNKDAVKIAKTLYDVTAQIKKDQEIAEKIMRLEQRKIKTDEIKGRKRNKLDPERYKKAANIRKQVESMEYAGACREYMVNLNSNLARLARAISDINTRANTSIEYAFECASLVKECHEILEANRDIIEELASFENYSNKGLLGISSGDAQSISSVALRILQQMVLLKKTVQDNEFDILKNVFEKFWTGDKTIPFGPDKGKIITLDQIMKFNINDSGVISNLFMSMGDSPDMLLGLIYKIVNDAKNRRNLKLVDINTKIRAIHKKLGLAGIKDTSFMFLYDENGVPTGYLISNINWDLYREEKKRKAKELREMNLPFSDFIDKLDEWVKENTEELIIRDEQGNEIRREIVPKSSDRSDKYFIDRLSKLSDAEREYYNSMIVLKATMDNLLPERATSLFKAVQIRNSLPEALSGVKSTKEGMKMILDNAKDKFVRRVDDEEFGFQYLSDYSDDDAEAADNSIHVTLNYKGDAILKSVPVYYTKKLEDMKRLSTDFTGAMSAYSAMAVNYSEMHTIEDTMELARDLVASREVQQKYGKSPLVDIVIKAKTRYATRFTKTGGGSAKKLDDFLDATLYDINKLNEGTVEVFGTELDTAKMMDTLKSYTSLVGLGLNTFSAISNITVGKIQLIIEASASKYFGPKELALAHKDYYGDILAYMGELNSYQRNSKMALLIDKFNALEEFFDRLKAQGKFKGPLSRMYNNFSFIFMNHMGEHYLHCLTMYAMLEKEKVKLNGKEVSLLSVLKSEDIKDKNGNVLATKLVIEDGVTSLDGKLLFSSKLEKELEELKAKDSLTDDEKARYQELTTLSKDTEDMYVRMTTRINKVNKLLNGAFNTKDYGMLHRYGLGRLAMNFRQWMPAHYERRFGKLKYSEELGEWREGFHRTFGRYLLTSIKDVKDLKFTIITQWDTLTDTEKENMKRAIAEYGIFWILAFLASAMSGVKDKGKGTWLERIALYTIHRSKLEVGASAITTDFIPNILQLLRSPLPATKTIDGLANLLEFWNIWLEVQSGRFKGMSVYLRDIILSSPLYGKVVAVQELSTENYMFNIFNKRY